MSDEDEIERAVWRYAPFLHRYTVRVIPCTYDMHILIGIHAVFGEAGALAFLWVLIELLNPSESRLRRARIAAALGTLLLSGAWFFGGFYYVTEYGVAVKPIIKSGPLPWTHDVITETKEHIFLFLPLLSALLCLLLS